MGVLPPDILPKWLLFVGAVATTNAIQCFADHNVYRKVIYKRNPAMVTPLMSRMFGVWNLLSSVIRICCAYEMHDKTLYRLTMFTFALALAHFWSEILIFKTAAVQAPGIVSSSIFAITSLVFMIAQYSHYTA